MKPIRVAPKAVIIENGKLLAVKISDGGGSWYILPGGGQESGETLHEALRRECREEIGVEVEVGEMLGLREYIGRNHEFADHDAKVHQTELMFACTIRNGEAPRMGSAPDGNQVGVEWLAMAQLDSYRLYPQVLKGVLGAGGWTGGIYLGDVN